MAYTRLQQKISAPNTAKTTYLSDDELLLVVLHLHEVGVDVVGLGWDIQTQRDDASGQTRYFMGSVLFHVTSEDVKNILTFVQLDQLLVVLLLDLFQGEALHFLQEVLDECEVVLGEGTLLLARLLKIQITITSNKVVQKLCYTVTYLGSNAIPLGLGFTVLASSHIFFL